jgi:hypothetical protein
MTHLNIYNTSYGKKERPIIKISNLTPDHKKSGIDSTSMGAGGMQHVVEKLLMRPTTLL